MASTLKPFTITPSDLQFLLDQVQFPTLKIIGYDSLGQAIYGYVDASGNTFTPDGVPFTYTAGMVAPAGTHIGTFNPLASPVPYYSALDPIGVRNVDGTLNNLTNAGTSTWGSAGDPFIRLVHSDYSHYVKESLSATPSTTHPFASALDTTSHTFNTTNGVTTQADYSNPLANVVDYTPRMISQTVTSSSSAENPINAMDVAIAQGLATEDFTFTATDGTVHTETFVRNVNSVALDPSLSGWNTLFGQFFDHGLDFIAKPGTGPTITIALSTDDPLYGTMGNDGRPVTAITINRATPSTTGANGVDYINHDSPYIDQNQTYGATDQITSLLREWVSTDGGATYHAGAALFDGHQSVAYNSKVFDDAGGSVGLGTATTTRTLPTLDELRDYLAHTGRDGLTWEDISNYRLRDGAGHVMAGNLGSGQAIVLDMNPRFTLTQLNPDDGNALTTWDSSVTTKVDAAISTLSAAVAAMNVTGLTFGWDAGHTTIQLVIPPPGFGPSAPAGTYTGATAMALWVNFADFSITAPAGAVHDAVGELLMASIGDHYVAGDGRANENFGLTALHHVFHEDHNVQLINLENTILAQADPTIRNSYQINTGTTDGQGNFTATFTDSAGSHTGIAWDEDKLFQATKIIVEMEYQHVAIDQYARRITPDLPEFVTYDSNINADISIEYAQAAFRFGHSQLRETIDTLDPNGAINGAIQHYLLKDAFLNPQDFASEGAGAIAQGLTRQVGNEVDEFVTPALQQNLLGQPLDLAAINIARGRDLGLPTLNETRKALYDALVAERADPNFNVNGPHAKLQLDLLKPYNSWNEFEGNMAHRESLVNFIAAYAFDGDRAQAQAILDADATGVTQSYAGGTVTAFQASQFLTGAKDAAGNYLQAGAGAFNSIDLWLGGLAESHVLGGALGYTFNAIFEDQMERLMDGDRFYYLYRLANALPAFTDVNQSIVTEQFKDIIERTTGVQHLNGDVMSHADSILELSQTANVGIPLLNTDGTIRYVTQTIGGVVSDTSTPVLETAQNAHKYGVFDELSSADGSVLVANQTLAGFAAGHAGNGVFSAAGHNTAFNGMDVVIQNPEDHTFGTYIQDLRPDSPYTSSNGNPTYGYLSHEVIAGTAYNDYIDTGDGDDTAYGDAGNDVLIGNGGGGHLYGGDGNDILIGGGGTTGADVEDFLDGGAGDDTMYGGQNNGAVEVMIGGTGNDRMYGESGIEEMYGMQGDDYIDAGGDTDLAFGGYGNDYLFGGEGPDELHGDSGDDIISGGTGTDKLLGEAGDDILLGGIGQGSAVGDSDELIGDIGFDIANYSDSNGKIDVALDLNNQNLVATPGGTPFNPFNQLLTGIEGAVGTKFDDQFGAAASPTAGLIGNDTDNWLIGGSGNDGMAGNGGNDVIVGGSIRLDTLIGTYNDTYNHTLADGTSHRVSDTATLSAGLLGAVNALGGAQFAKHFTDLLRSDAYKNYLLGDFGTDGTSDFAVLTGNLKDYTVLALDSAGLVIADPFSAPASGPGSIFAVRITDNGGLNPDGTVRATNDGTDLVIGVEKFQFADGTRSLGQLFNHAPTGSVAFTVEDNSPNVVGTNAQDANAVRLTGANTIADADGIASPISYAWKDAANVAITTTGSATLPYVDGNSRLILHTTAGTLVNEVASYTDGAGKLETVSKTWNMVVGTSGTDAALNGTASLTVDDAIFGLAGNDTLNGLAGNDRLFGGTGNDALIGGDGNDYLDGGANNSTGGDTMTGGAGDDTYVIDDVSGGAANRDSVVEAVGGGTDTVTGNVNLDLANYANVENITLTGNSGVSATGNSGDNVITGNSGSNTLSGLGGNDTYRFALNGGSDTINETGGTADRIAILTGGAALSSLSFSDSSGARPGGNLVVGYNGQTITAVNHFNAGNAASIELINFDNGSFAGYQFGTGDYAISASDPAGATRTVSVAASTANNLLAGESGADSMTGGTGNDLLFGAGGSDTLNGGGGADLLVGGTGNDIVNGDAGDDVIAYTIGDGADTVNGGADNDRLSIIGTNGGDTLDVIYNGTSITNFEGGTVTNVESVTSDLLGGTNTLSYTGSTAGVTVNLALGTASGFTSIANVDNVVGTGNADILIGTAGNNTLTGGAGNDTYTVDNTGDSVVETNGTANGIDLVNSLANTYTISDADVENLTFIGVGNFTGTGNASSNVLTGGAGADTLRGAGGADTLIGGAGNDTFVFTSTSDSTVGANHDIIMDFTTGDIIDLLAIDANTTVGGGGGNGQTFSFIGTAAFSDSNAGATLAAGQVHYFLDGLGNTIVQANVDNNLAPDFEILLKNYTGTLLATDFNL